MHALLEYTFRESPTRRRIVEGLFDRGISVKGGHFYVDNIEIPTSEVAKAFHVNRRTVYETLRQISSDPVVAAVMSSNKPDFNFTQVAPKIGSQVVTIYITGGYFQRVISGFFSMFGSYMAYVGEILSRTEKSGENFIRLIMKTPIPRESLAEFALLKGVKKIKVTEPERDSPSFLCRLCQVLTCPNKVSSPIVQSIEGQAAFW